MLVYIKCFGVSWHCTSKCGKVWKWYNKYRYRNTYNYMLSFPVFILFRNVVVFSNYLCSIVYACRDVVALLLLREFLFFNVQYIVNCPFFASSFAMFSQPFVPACPLLIPLFPTFSSCLAIITFLSHISWCMLPFYHWSRSPFLLVIYNLLDGFAYLPFWCSIFSLASQP